MWKEFVKDYFTFSKKERFGIYTLLGLIMACIVLPFLFPYFVRSEKDDSNDLHRAVAELKAMEDSNAEITPASERYSKKFPKRFSEYLKNHEYSKKQEFVFDPNTLPEIQWRRLGIPEKTIHTIQKYLAKGGHFYRPADLGKIWGLHPDDVTRLIPFVHIREVQKEYPSFNSPRIHSYHKREIEPFNINLADSTQLDDLPGIGGHLAKRILSFREKLGGFYNVQQVSETYGLPDSTFQKMKTKLFIGNDGLKKININMATVEQLKAHPYIRYALANAIVQYRNQHGNFAAVSDIKKIMVMSDLIYQRLSPYLVVTP